MAALCVSDSHMQSELCDMCRKNVAAFHGLRTVTGEIRNLCAACLQKLAEEIQLNPTCRHCGRPVDDGGPLCEACYDEGLEFLNRPENVTLPNDASDEQKFSQLMELLKKYKEYEARKKAKRNQSDES